MGMIDESSTMDFSVISEKIRNIESKIDELSSKISNLEGNKISIAAEGNAESVATIVQNDPTVSLPLIESNEGLGEWISKGALLQKMAIICFILVFALLLRTITDYGYVNAIAGSLLGLAYVSILAAIGCVFYVTGKSMANVFAISGFLLLFTIVFEGYGRFGTIPISLAYVILLVALVSSTFVGIKYQVAKLLSVSLVGVTICSLAIGFPKVHFPLSGLVILVANWMAIIASERLVGGKVKWPVTILTFIFFALWSFKAYVPLSRGVLVPEYIYLNWLAPLLICFVVLYFMTYVRRYFSDAKLAVYDAVIPSLNMLLFLLVGNVAVKEYLHQPWLLGLLALTMGCIHFFVGWRLSKNDSERFVGVGGAFVAGSIALALGVVLVVSNVAWAISFWSLLAYGLARLSGRCESGVIRIMSYLYQVFAILTGLALGVFEAGIDVTSKATLIAAMALALFGMLQFNWCRSNPPPEGTLFEKLDSRDYSAVVLLLVGLSGLYLTSSMIIDSFASIILADPLNAIKCSRSIIINLAATVLLILGGRQHDMEFVWIAVFLAIVGCLKVFLVDLFGTSGIPLVLSVLSFGVVAMVASIVMGKWHKPVVN